jgi:hypothetical protein
MKRAPLQRKAPLRRAQTVAKLAIPVFRPKRCKACKTTFTPARQMQTACSPTCAIELATAVRAKAERAADRAKRETLKTRSDWMVEAQNAFNRYIRLRDAGKPCICCGRFSNGTGADRGGEWDAGHYRSRGAAPELRFDERNVHAQLKQCNRRAFDVAGYRANLIARIGLEQVLDIEGQHPPRKYTAEDLKAIRDTYRCRARELEQAAKGQQL